MIILKIVLKNIKKMSNNVSTTEELLKDKTQFGTYDNMYPRDQVAKKMIEFAKLHVEAALKEANKKAVMTGYVDSGQTILNAYPLENIK